MIHDNHCSGGDEAWVYKTPPAVRRRATIAHLALSALIVLPALGVLAHVALSGFGAQRFWHALLVIGLGYAWVRHLQLYHTGSVRYDGEEILFGRRIRFLPNEILIIRGNEGKGGWRLSTVEVMGKRGFISRHCAVFLNPCGVREAFDKLSHLSRRAALIYRSGKRIEARSPEDVALLTRNDARRVLAHLRTPRSVCLPIGLCFLVCGIYLAIDEYGHYSEWGHYRLKWALLALVGIWLVLLWWSAEVRWWPARRLIREVMKNAKKYVDKEVEI